jgi:chitodextrinase
VGAAVEEFEARASEVTDRIEEANRLFRAAASGQVDPNLITGEISSLLDLVGRLDKNGRFEEELELMRSLNGLVVLALRWLELLRSLRSMLESAQTAGHQAARAFAHHELGTLHLVAGEPEKAEEHLREALRIEDELGDFVSRCATRHNLDSARRDRALPRGGRAQPPRRLLRLVGLAVIAALVGAGVTGIAVAIRNGGGDGPTPPAVTHTVTVERAGAGSGSVTGPGLACPTDCDAEIADGDGVTLTATASPGSIFDHWGGVDCRQQQACTFTVAADVTATATFKRSTDTQAPSAPGNLQAKAVSAGQIDLSWSASSDNVGIKTYVVYRDSARLATVVGTKTTYHDTGLAASTEYVYSVRAADAAKNASAPSNEAKATTLAPADTEAPSTPTDLRAKAMSSSEIDLSWTQSSDNVAVTGYIVYRNNERLTTVPGTASTYKDTSLAASTGYVYTVQATDAAGNRSGQSNRTKAKTLASADTEAPSTPTTLTATPVSSAEIDLSWAASSDNVAVTGYIISRDGTMLTTVPGTTTTYRDTSVAASTAYNYTVEATDAAGNLSGQSKVARTKTGPAPGPQ